MILNGLSLFRCFWAYGEIWDHAWFAPRSCRVRVPLVSTQYAGLAQLARALFLQEIGRGFESLILHCDRTQIG